MTHWLTLWFTRPRRRRLSRQEWASIAHQLGAPLVDRTSEHQDVTRALKRAWLRDGAK